MSSAGDLPCRATFSQDFVSSLGNGGRVDLEPAELSVQMTPVGETGHVLLTDIAALVEADSVFQARFQQEVRFVHIDAKQGDAGLYAAYVLGPVTGASEYDTRFPCFSR